MYVKLSLRGFHGGFRRHFRKFKNSRGVACTFTRVYGVSAMVQRVRAGFQAVLESFQKVSVDFERVLEK